MYISNAHNNINEYVKAHEYVRLTMINRTKEKPQ